MTTKNAICLIGGISTSYNSHNSLIETHNLIDYHAVARVNKKFIFNHNSNIDVFIHCWTPSAEADMVQLYNPKSYLFEDNAIYNTVLRNKCWNKDDLRLRGRGQFEFNRASFFLSIKKCLTLMHEYKSTTNTSYDKVMIYRPDVVINKPLILSDFPVGENLVLCNNGKSHPGDFHYVMDENTSYKFSTLYDNIEVGRKFQPSSDIIDIRSMPLDIAKYIGIEIRQLSNFIAGRDQEVARKCRWNWKQI